jgi:threonine aldolase
LCLSKGLGAPVGSLLLGSFAFIQQARRLRKMLGGGMRQAGVLAAAGLYALQHHIERLAEDHQHAQQLAEGLQRIAAEHPRLKGKLELVSVHTNILFTDIALEVAEPLLAHLAAHGIRLTSSNYNKADQHYKRVRWVTHLDICSTDIQQALDTVGRF